MRAAPNLWIRESGRRCGQVYDFLTGRGTATGTLIGLRSSGGDKCECSGSAVVR